MERPNSRYLVRILSVIAAGAASVSVCLMQAPLRNVVAAPTSVSLQPDLPSGQLVGTPVTWTATATGAAEPVYRFSVAYGGGPFRIVRDFRIKRTFTYAAIREGAYTFKVTVGDSYSSTQFIERTVTYTVLPRATSAPMVTPTANALVALYSAPPCGAGSMTVMFRPTGTTAWEFTNAMTCVPGQSLNIYVAGMRGATAYDIQHVIVDGPTRVFGPLLSFTTGTPPSLPAHAVILPPDPASSSVADDVVLHSLASAVPPGSQIWAYATDLAGRIIWYFDGSPNAAPFRLLRGGTVLMQTAESGKRGYVLSEVDLAGNILRETSVARINAQLVANGQQHLLGLHHDALRTPAGLTLVMGHTERLFTDVQGVSGEVDIIGDSIIALDQDWQVVWEWDSFEHLDINRVATLNDKCAVIHILCPPLELAPVANDWLHTNSFDLMPDGGLLVSVRNQDWIIKIDFAGGTGTGNVLWRLGKDGDFTVQSSDPYPWFSHQHSITVAGPSQVALFDNSNLRCEGAGPDCHSRGQVFTLNEASRQATLALNADLGSYSNAWGAAFRLSNGNLGFMSGKQPAPGGSYFGDTIEVRPDGVKVYDLRANAPMYRTFRMKNLYLR